MIFSILDFNQEKVMQLNETIKPKLDMNDLLLLRYVMEAQVNPSIEHIYKDNVVYAWIKHKDVLEDFPILNIKLDTLSRKLKYLEQVGLLLSKQKSTSGIIGSRTFYAVTDLCMNLRQNETRVPGKKSGQLPGKKRDSINTPYINSYNTNIKDNNIKEPIKDIKNIKVYTGNRKKKELFNSTDTTEEIIKYYQMNCTGLKQIRVITDSRKKAVKDILKRYGKDTVLEVLDKAQNSSFLTGKTGTWTADFDWIFKEKNFIKILEGNYDRNFTDKKKDVFSEFGEVKSVAVNRQKKAEYIEKLRKEGEQVEY